MSDATWTEERVERLKKLADTGWSAQQIADDLAGPTRSAVIGKAYRLGIELRGNSGPPANVTVRSPKSRPAVQRAPAAARVADRPRPAPEPEAEPALPVDPMPKSWPKPAGPEAVTLVDLDMAKQCRMPLWSHAERSGLYCGKPVRREGSRYCSACARLMYEPARGRSRPDDHLSRQSSRSGAFA